MGPKTTDVVDRAGAQIIQDNDLLPACDKSLGQMRTNKTRTASD